VERIEGFCSEEEWRRAYFEINEMEEQWANFGTVILKFWLHISSEEQLERFKRRQEISHKQWKITEEDYRNRGKWDIYKEAVDEMLYRTSTAHAPWSIIASNDKLYARVKALSTTVKAIEERLS
jgi:polyphosphate kinase 2 (PPK2 family)